MAEVDVLPLNWVGFGPCLDGSLRPGDTIWAVLVHAPQRVRPIAVTVYLNVTSAGSRGRVALYDATGTAGRPGALIVESAADQALVDFANAFALPHSVVPAGPLWIAFRQDAENFLWTGAAGAGWRAVKDGSYGAFPDPLGSTDDDTTTPLAFSVSLLPVPA
jgi:hypothetical protein